MPELPLTRSVCDQLADVALTRTPVFGHPNLRPPLIPQDALDLVRGQEVAEYVLCLFASLSH